MHYEIFDGIMIVVLVENGLVMVAKTEMPSTSSRLSGVCMFSRKEGKGVLAGHNKTMQHENKMR